jgi:hypothetical protein
VQSRRESNLLSIMVNHLKTAFQSEKMHGILFDAAVFGGNIVLVGFLPRLGDEIADTTAGFLLLMAVLTQSAGAWLKKSFLGQRLARRKHLLPAGPVRGFMNVLLFLHFLLFSMITLFACALLGFYDMEGSLRFFQGDVWVLIAILAGGFTTYRVWSAGQPRETSSRVGAQARWLEYAADGLLWLSVSLVTRIFWDGLIGLVESARGIGINPRGILLLVAVSFLYIIFYLPSRYLFLVEDYRSELTWIRVALVMSPVVWLVIVG